ELPDDRDTYEGDLPFDQDDYDETPFEDEDDRVHDVLASAEQRLEEGRQRFQLVMARLLEQRVILAFREQVAQAKADELLREL
ncbi:hypothetical protein BJ085DRAFT_8314, partial [Dimargaris cristalligena]